MRFSVLLIVTVLAGAGQAEESGTLERVKVFGESLEGNLEGDDPNRNVIVYLPPSYSQVTSTKHLRTKDRLVSSQVLTTSRPCQVGHSRPGLTAWRRTSGTKRRVALARI